jgi:RNA polymerase sigma factor FliA
MYNATGKFDRENLVQQHAPLVRRIAHQLAAKLPASVEVDDLIQIGMIGLLDAISRYEDNHGAKFETYASQRIRGAMLDELREQDWLPRSLRSSMRKVESAISKVEQRVGRPATESEIAKEMGVKLTDYQETLRDGRGHQIVYFEDFQGEGDEHFLDRQEVSTQRDPLGEMLDGELRSVLIDAIDALPERERTLMGLYYVEELTLKEIGQVLEVTESRVCQLRTQAVARLRTHLRERAWMARA